MAEAKVTIEEKKKNAIKLIDPPPLEQMCQKIEPAKLTKHGFPERTSLHGKSGLEKFHLALAKYGNTRMGPELGDLLTLDGRSIHNARI